MKDIVLIKLGGSLITDKKVPYSARIDVIRRLAKELKSYKKNVIIAHGSGSFGHTSAAKYGGKKGYKSISGIAKVARDAMEINRIVMDILIEENIPAVSLRPMSMILAKEGKIDKNLFEIIETLLSQGLIPVVYGDVIWDKKWKSTIFSGETTLNKIGAYLKNKDYKIKRIIQAGETKGFYDAEKNTISEITKNSWPKIKRFIYKLKTKDVTGGILHKVEDALMMTELGIETILIDGNKKNELSNALLGKEVGGTTIR